MLFLYNSKNSEGNDYSGDGLNKNRSSLSYFLKYDFPNLGYDDIITRLFRMISKTRPSFPRYTVTWDVGQVLRFLVTWHPPDTLSLKQLTLKTIVIIALTSSVRAQALKH